MSRYEGRDLEVWFTNQSGERVNISNWNIAAITDTFVRFYFHFDRRDGIDRFEDYDRRCIEIIDITDLPMLSGAILKPTNEPMLGSRNIRTDED